MNSTIKICLIIIVVMVVACQTVTARSLNYRIKRISENHLADLETKIGFNQNYKGVVVTMPVAGGRLDPKKIGRKRRSDSRIFDILFNQSEEDRGDPLEDYEELFNNYRLQ